MANKNYNSNYSTFGFDKSGNRVTVNIQGRPGMTDSQMNHLVRDMAKNRGLSGVTGVSKSSNHK